MLMRVLTAIPQDANVLYQWSPEIFQGKMERIYPSIRRAMAGGRKIEHFKVMHGH